MKRISTFLIAAATVLAACSDLPVSDVAGPGDHQPAFAVQGLGSDDVQPTGRYIVLARTDLPADLDAQISAAGGTLVRTIPEVGVAVAEATAPDFVARASRIRGIESVTPDLRIKWVDPKLGRSEDIEAEFRFDAEGHIGANAFFGSFQWAPGAIQAPEAWHEGYTGQGVRVAILDGAIHSAHLDLAPNLDVAASRSFVAGTAFNQDIGTFWHGTHVAGIVAASGNVGTVGIAPRATLIGVKVLHGGSGSFEDVLDGVIYAATPLAQGGAGAHIINLSLGATIDKRGNWRDPAFRDFFRELTKTWDRGFRYAYQQGVTVIASAGNDGRNFDVMKNLYKIPSETQHAVTVSATGPHGWALGATNFEKPAYYTDHGKSLVDIAAPGGTIGLWLVDGVDQICVVQGQFTTIIQFCEVFDMIFSTVRGTTNASYNWAQGTSMAAPAAAGVAALIIERNGGQMNPGAVRAALQASAIDHGKPGKDEFYGHGWVSALRAVTR